MKTLAVITAITISLGTAPVIATAQTTRAGTITMVRTGWNVDSFAVVTAEPIVNPARCPTADGYLSMKSAPGYSTYYAAALTGYLAARPAVFTVHDSECEMGRPKLIGINLPR
jgi:hypothetical protein